MAKMNIIEATKQLRDDLKLWVANNLREKADKDYVNEKIAEIPEVDLFYATPQMYGAVGDGITDDTAALNECLADNSFVYIPSGVYLIDATISINPISNQTIFIDNNAILKGYTNGIVSGCVVKCERLNNTVIIGGSVCGNRMDSEDGSGDDIRYGIVIKGCKNTTIKGVKVYSHCGDGIIVNPVIGAAEEYAENIAENTKIVECEIYNCSRHGIFIDGVDGLLVKDVDIHDCNTFDYSCAIDLEIHYDWHTIKNVRLENVKSYNTKLGIQYGAHENEDALSGFEIESCEFDRISIPTTSTLNNSTINNLVCNMAKEIYVYNSIISTIFFKNNANLATFYNCEIGGINDAAAISVEPGAESSSIQAKFYNCNLTSFKSDIRDTACILILCNSGANLTFDNCNIYINNPNGMCTGANKLIINNSYIKVTNNFAQYTYPLFLSIKTSTELTNNTLDFQEMPISSNEMFRSNNKVILINNTILGKGYNKLLGAAQGVSLIGNTFRDHTMANILGNKTEDIIIDNVNNITVDTIDADVNEQQVQSMINEAIVNLPTYEGTYREIYTGETEEV